MSRRSAHLCRQLLRRGATPPPFSAQVQELLRGDAEGEKVTVNEPQKFPVFREPEDYMKMRERPNLSGWLKKAFERRALNRCLKDLPDVKSIVDVPSGPGRLFFHWKELGYKVTGIDYSEQMAEAAGRLHGKLALDGAVRQGNAFELAGALDEQPDLVACVRFAYYFDRARRVELLRSLAAATRRYVLVQYKTRQTLKGFMNESRKSETRARDREQHMAKVGCTHHEILHELSEAGLVPLRIEVIGEFSDRVYVLAERPQITAAGFEEGRLISIRPPMRIQMATMLIILFGIIYCMNIGDQSFWTKEEALYSLAARSVLEGNFLLPMLDQTNAAPVAPLAPWWIAGICSIFGSVTEITARLANILTALGVLVLLHSFMRKTVNSWAALLGVAILGTSYEFWLNAAEAGFEMLFGGLLFISLATAYNIIQEGTSRAKVILLWLTAALSALCAGPYAPLLVLFIISGYCLVEHGRKAWQKIRLINPFAGLLVSLVPYAAWLGAVSASPGGGENARLVLSNTLIGQLIVDPGAYAIEPESLPDMLYNLLPWSLLFPFIAWDLSIGARRRREKLHPSTVFSLCVVLFGLLLHVLLMVTQDWQLIPLMPWAAIVIANYLWRRLVGFTNAAEDAAYEGRRFGGRLLGLRFGRVMIATFSVLILGIGFYRSFALPFMDRERSIKPLALAVESAVDANDGLILFDYHDPRLMYYLREKFTLLEEDSADMNALRELLASGGEYDLVLKRSAAHHLMELEGVQLYIEATPQYRHDRYIILTTEKRPGALPFNGKTGQLMVPVSSVFG